MIYDQVVLLGGGLALGILLDLVFGDPQNRYHPVSWLGRLIESVTPNLKHSEVTASSISQDKIEKVKGILFSCGLISTIALLTIALTSLSVHFAGLLAHHNSVCSFIKDINSIERNGEICYSDHSLN